MHTKSAYFESALCGMTQSAEQSRASTLMFPSTPLLFIPMLLGYTQSLKHELPMNSSGRNLLACDQAVIISSETGIPFSLSRGKLLRAGMLCRRLTWKGMQLCAVDHMLIKMSTQLACPSKSAICTEPYTQLCSTLWSGSRGMRTNQVHFETDMLWHERSVEESQSFTPASPLPPAHTSSSHPCCWPTPKAWKPELPMNFS